METKRVLEGVKIVDFSWAIAVPLATRFLGEFGAEVIKIECHARPDENRMLAPFKDDISGVNRSGYFANICADRYGITLNFNDPQAVEIAKRLVSRADVVTEAFIPGKMKKWGLDYEELRKVKPDIIMLSHAAQGQTGPFALVPMLGYYAQAGTGITELTGWPDREPAGTATAYPDYPAAWLVVVAIMAALHHRRRTGKGQYIDIAQFEVTLNFMASTFLDCTVNGRVQTRMGNRSGRAAPHGAYPCRGDNRWCIIAVSTDQEWHGFCQVMGNPAWTGDPRFATLLGRKKNEDELDALVGEWTIKQTAEEVINLMQAAGVPAGVVQNGADLIDRDPQLKYRQHFWKLDHAEMGPRICQAPPFKLSKTPAELRMPFPSLGEHNEYICRQILGMSDKEFAGLLEKGTLDC